jgi:phage terminase large subunit GpA-like protein
MGIVADAFLPALEPPPQITVSEWADRFRMLSPEASAEPGQWATARAPYQREVMDALNDDDVHTIVMMSSAQVGKTEILLNTIGYLIDLDPCAVLVVQPTLEMAEAFSKDRLEPMLRDSPALRSKVSVGKRDASNTIRHKAFPGGQITLAGSNSPAGLASRPIRIVLADEVDRWDVSDEGDPLALASRRTATYWNAKHIVVSTPTIRGGSRIEAKFEESDQRRCYLPCPHCATRHVLTWQYVKWTDRNPETAHLVCPECGAVIDEAGRAVMLQSPEWRATAPFRGIAGFHLWEGYSPWRRLADIVADFLEAKKSADTLQVFVNTSLGESWEEQGEQAEGHVLLARRKPYPAQVPLGACCLTMGVDVQDSRLEALVIGWGPGEEAWIVETFDFPGDPQRPEPWTGLDLVLAQSFTHESGALLTVSATCIDTGGHRTDYAYDYVRHRTHQRVHAVKGIGGDHPIVSAPSRRGSGTERRKVDLYSIGVDQAKAVIYSRLKVTEPGAGYVHLPLPHQLPDKTFRFGVDEEFVAQLTAEKLVTKHRNGIATKQWVRTRPRNEALDMFVYGLAGLRLLRPNLEALAAALRPKTTPQPPPTPAPTVNRWVQPPRPNWFRSNR